jgi:hypothetical protein
MNVYLVEDCLEDVKEIKGWINLVNNQLENPDSALSRWCKDQGFNIKGFSFEHINGTDKNNSTNRHQCYREEDVSNILDSLSKNTDDKLLLLDIKLIEGQRDNEPATIASELLNEIYRQPDLKVKVLVVTYVSTAYDQLDELLTCNPLPAYMSKASLYPTFYTQQNLRAFVFFSQNGRFPRPDEINLEKNFDTEAHK